MDILNIIILISDISSIILFLYTNEISLYIIVIKGHFGGNGNVLRIRVGSELVLFCISISLMCVNIYIWSLSRIS